jgi:hypothetical protein
LVVVGEAPPRSLYLSFWIPTKAEGEGGKSSKAEDAQRQLFAAALDWPGPARERASSAGWQEDRVSEQDALGKESERMGWDTEPDTKQMEIERHCWMVFSSIFSLFYKIKLI